MADTALLQSIWLCLPLTLGGITHVAVIRRNALPSLAQWPLDGGMQFRGRDLFGANKTVRGAIVMICATIFWTVVLDGLQAGLNLAAGLRYIPKEQLGSIAQGALLGSAYIVGELPNSFIKRQLNIPPGSAATGFLKILFWFIDQADSAVAIMIVLCFFKPPDFAVYLWVIALTLILNPIVAALMVAIGLKQRVG